MSDIPEMPEELRTLMRGSLGKIMAGRLHDDAKELSELSMKAAVIGVPSAYLALLGGKDLNPKAHSLVIVLCGEIPLDILKSVATFAHSAILDIRSENPEMFKDMHEERRGEDTDGLNG